MEVTHLDQFDTHAVIGGAKAQAFRMAETAEFFTVLSDTLYSNKKLAVVREVICNAWDAHIKAGKKDTPVRITLNEKELIIEDQGPGIPEDAIVDIYCTYGKSTKVQDDDQTGGFGLGSKAPFAYTAHFTVINKHKGFRTVYAVSRGSTQTGGKPDIRQMVRVPDDTTGVTVTIPLVNSIDDTEFKSLIEKVVMHGEINATLNGQPLQTLDLSLARQIGFTLSYNGSLPRYAVRYGSVIYPINMDHQELTGYAIDTFRGHNVKFLFVAPPNSIGVTPSRESLSYTDRTIETIKGLLDNARNYLKVFSNRDHILKKERQIPFFSVHDIFNISESKSFYSMSEGTLCLSEADISDFMACVGSFGATPEERIVARLKGLLNRKFKNPKEVNKGRIRKLLRLMYQMRYKKRKSHFSKGYYDEVYKYAKEKNFWSRNRKLFEQLLAYRKVLDGACFKSDESGYYTRFPSLYKTNLVGLVRTLEKRKFTSIMVVKSKAEYERWFTSSGFAEHVKWTQETGLKANMESYDFRSYRAKKLHKTLIILAPANIMAQVNKIAEILQIKDVFTATAEKKRVEVETKLYNTEDLVLLREDSDMMRFTIKDKKRSSEKFTLMIPCRNPKEGQATIYPNHRHKNLRQILNYFARKDQKTGVVITANEKALALANGVQILNDAIIAELEKIKKSPRLLTLISLGDLHVNYEEWDSRKKAENIEKWLRVSEEFRRIALPSIPKLNEEEQRLYAFWNDLNDRGSHEAYSALITIRNEIYELANKQPKTQEIRSALYYRKFERKFPGIGHLRGDMTPDLMNILKMLRKLGAKANKGEAANG